MLPSLPPKPGSYSGVRPVTCSSLCPGAGMLSLEHVVLMYHLWQDKRGLGREPGECVGDEGRKGGEGRKRREGPRERG